MHGFGSDEKGAWLLLCMKRLAKFCLEQYWYGHLYRVCVGG